MSAKKTDNRARPRIHRTDDKHDKALRAYAKEHGIKPWQALEVAIARLPWLDGPTMSALRADLESAREATRRADAEIERLTADWRAALAETERVKALALERAGTDATEIKRLARELTISEENTAAAVRLVNRREKELAGERLKTEAAQAREQQARAEAADLQARRPAPAPCACALPDDLAPRLAAIAARRDVEPHVMLANVIKNGISKIEASDKYQDAQKAARARS